MHNLMHTIHAACIIKITRSEASTSSNFNFSVLNITGSRSVLEYLWCSDFVDNLVNKQTN